MKSLFITGVTGTLGKAVLRASLSDSRWTRIVGYSRDEVKQSQIADEFSDAMATGPLRLFLGDVRDESRLALALRGVDVVVHAAALKRVDAGTYSPSEMIVTNVLGTMNVVNAAIHAGVRRVVVISSDKAVSPQSLYGFTKGCAESYAIHANTYGFPSGTLIAAVRYGNVLGSRGSVVHRWREQAAAGQPLTLTSPKMSRFIMVIEQAVALIDFALATMVGGEIFVPVLSSASMVNLAHASAPGDLVITGLRPGGEKLAESLLNEEEVTRTRRVTADYLSIVPGHHEWTALDKWIGTSIDPGTVYRSDMPEAIGSRWLSVDELRSLIEATEAMR